MISQAMADALDEVETKLRAASVSEIHLWAEPWYDGPTGKEVRVTARVRGPGMIGEYRMMSLLEVLEAIDAGGEP